MTTPYVYVSDVSGYQGPASPPCRKLYWPAGLSRRGRRSCRRIRRCQARRSRSDAASRRSPAELSRTARIARQVEQVEALRGEQLDDVRRTNRTLIAGAEAHVLHRRPVHADLVRVGGDRVVVGVAVGQLQSRADPRTRASCTSGTRTSVNRSSTLVEPEMPIVAPPAPDSRFCDVGSSVTFVRRSQRFSMPNATLMLSVADGLLMP